MFTLRTVAVALMMLVSVNAFAAKTKPVAPKPKPVEQPTPFSELAAAFEKAEPAHISEIDGMYAGRCFEKNYKTSMLPGLLAQMTFESGPNFPQTTYVFRYSSSEKYRALDAFDVINTNEEKHELVEQTARYPLTWPLSAPKEDEKGISYSDFYSNTRTPFQIIEIRGANGVYFSKATVVASVDMNLRTTGERLSFSPGTVTEYCYYFRQVMPKADIPKFR